MKNKELKLLAVILFVLIAIAGGVVAYKVLIKKQPVEPSNEIISEEDNKEENVVVSQKQINIYNGEDRPIAFMIDNHSGAWPQINISQAYMVYEIIVEGGETRLMALFKGKNLEQVGPIRSSRHYFLDYALENDAIYVHHGWSPQAEQDISTLGVNNINGITESSSSFWRIKGKSAPHNLVTSTEKILKIAERKGYRTTSTQKSVLNYVADEVELSEEDSITAETVTIPHSNLQTVKYEYNPETKTYTRYARGKLQKDNITGEAITTKNIIITMCDNYTLADDEQKGRQGLKNIGTFDGYYITNGKAIKIKCTKSARNQKTQYKDLNGNEINVNDGNTFVNICPTDANIKIE